MKNVDFVVPGKLRQSANAAEINAWPAVQLMNLKAVASQFLAQQSFAIETCEHKAITVIQPPRDSGRQDLGTAYRERVEHGADGAARGA